MAFSLHSQILVLFLPHRPKSGALLPGPKGSQSLTQAVMIRQQLSSVFFTVTAAWDIVAGDFPLPWKAAPHAKYGNVDYVLYVLYYRYFSTTVQQSRPMRRDTMQESQASVPPPRKRVSHSRKCSSKSNRPDGRDGRLCSDEWFYPVKSISFYQKTFFLLHYMIIFLVNMCLSGKCWCDYRVLLHESGRGKQRRG